MQIIRKSSVNALYNNDAWGNMLHDPRLLATLLDSSPRFLWPLQERSGATTVADLSGNGRTGTPTDPSFGLLGPNLRVGSTLLFNGTTTKIVPAAGCSVRGLGTVTFVAIVKVTDTASSKFIWAEATGDSASVRLAVYLEANEILTVALRSGTSAQAISNVATDAALSVASHIIHITVNILTDTVVIYVDGAAPAQTGVPNFGADAVFADTAPISIYAGRGLSDAGPLWFPANMAYLGLYGSVLSTATIAAQARAAGFLAT